MSKIAVLVAMLCAVLATPVLGYWKYDGTVVSTSEPESDYAVDGTSWYGWDGWGDVDAGPYHLYAEAVTSGYAGVHLAPYWHAGLGRSAYAQSWTLGISSYYWEGETGDRELEVDIQFTMATSGIEYYGYAVDDTHVSVLTSHADVFGGAVGGLHDPNFPYPYPSVGYGYGTATTQSDSTAYNGAWDVTVTKDEKDSWNPPPYLYNMGYEGDLEFTCYRVIPPYFDEPAGNYFEVDASVYGGCSTHVDIEINDPFYYYLYAGAQANYGVSGLTEVDLFGDIR